MCNHTPGCPKCIKMNPIRSGLFVVHTWTVAAALVTNSPFNWTSGCFRKRLFLWILPEHGAGKKGDVNPKLQHCMKPQSLSKFISFHFNYFKCYPGLPHGAVVHILVLRPWWHSGLEDGANLTVPSPVFYKGGALKQVQMEGIFHDLSQRRAPWENVLPLLST